MSERRPLTDDQARVTAAACEAWQRMIIPDDAEMREVCSSLVERGDLDVVREGEGAPNLELDEIVGYLASGELRAAWEMRVGMN
jgi:hypothetical protein